MDLRRQQQLVRDGTVLTVSARGYCAVAYHPGDEPYLRETIVSLEIALRHLGRYDLRGTPIFFGVPPGAGLPVGSVVFEAEQLARPLWYDRPRGEVTWTHSGRIATELRRRGWGRVVHCPLGWVEGMPSVALRPQGERDIDVLFYGTPSARRSKILGAISRLRPTQSFGLERDELISRSKVVLNIHHYEVTSALEIFRLAHLWASGVAVVTEAGGEDEALEAVARRCSMSVPTDEIAGACARLVASEFAREDLGRRARLEFQKLDFVASVRRALEETEQLTP